MSLAISNIRLLTLTARKADCEYNISIDSMEKMAITREQSELSKLYYAKLQGKNIAFYANGQYNAMTYSYIMGNVSSLPSQLYGISDSRLQSCPIKSDNSMVLTDANGRVVMDKGYATILKEVLGDSCIDSNGRGATFSVDKIPELIAKASGGWVTAEDVIKIRNNESISTSGSGTTTNARTQEAKSSTTVDTTDSTTSKKKSIVDFYYPIFLAAATNGWTTEYDQEMSSNSNYISDALVSGVFNLEQVDATGGYLPDASLSYFVTQNLVVERTDSSVREEITAWYNAEKERINEKESWLDLEITDLSTELEAINTEMESVKSQLQDAMSAFEFATNS